MRKVLKPIIILGLLTFLFFTYGDEAQTSIKRWIAFSFCDRPIKYRIGEIDPQFNINSSYFVEATDAASGVWQEVLKKPIFERDQNGPLEVNLIYDGRQDLVTTISDLNSEVEQQKQGLDTTNSEYEQMRVQLEKEIEELNDAIEYWNNKGGAPKDEYDKLVRTQNELKRRIDQLNTMASKINLAVDTVNQQIGTLNSNVSTFNSWIKINPEVGVYTSGVNKIDIYFFGSREELVHVLAHEFGHALGLAHVGTPDAIMNPTSSINLKAAPADVLEITTFCKNKNRLDLIKNDMFNAAYTILSKLGDVKKSQN